MSTSKSAQKKKGKGAGLWPNPYGQPTKYREEYCEGIIEFFQDFERYEIVTEKFFNKDGDVIKEVSKKEPLPPPTFSGYAVHIGVCLDTLKDWTRAHPEFSKAYDRAKAIQQSFIIANSMQGVSPTAFSIFMMKNNHGWTDKVEQNITQKTTLENLVDSTFEGDQGE